MDWEYNKHVTSVLKFVSSLDETVGEAGARSDDEKTQNAIPPGRRPPASAAYVMGPNLAVSGLSSAEPSTVSNQTS